MKMITAKYLDECKKKLEISSTYALSAKTGLSESLLSNYYSGRSSPDDYACFKIAEVLGLDAAYVIASIKAETEKNEAKRNYFRSFSGASRTAVVSIVLAVLLSFSSLTAPMLGGVDKFQRAVALLFRRFHFV
jgi:transcriptional regulator with XRE-family HTH domain